MKIQENHESIEIAGAVPIDGHEWARIDGDVALIERGSPHVYSTDFDGHMHSTSSFMRAHVARALLDAYDAQLVEAQLERRGLRVLSVVPGVCTITTPIDQAQIDQG